MPAPRRGAALPVCGPGLRMRVLFVGLMTFIVLGLAFMITIGLLHR